MSEFLSPFSRPLPAALFIVVALVLDQVIKLAVELYLPLHEIVPLTPMLALYRTHNLGVAFSMLADAHGWFIVGLRIAIVAFVLWLWRRTGPGHHIAHLGFAMIIAGALGNIIDRFVYGHVVDYVLFYTQTWSFAVFNLADSLITIGAGLIFIDEILAHRASKA
ncbi:MULTISPECIES: signal peptidase II [Alphaproteobacteria]|uniref:Lipoprotein signal peptidase n=2 Tax=Alphaproteobacteria TaxID=28211 RepID=A0A512HDX3_9HYPH|nr:MULTISPECIES: signal peptidase II [Alphaproteobacteria]GEO83646.1 lipoprotein signal peptidase [Ciceribacter naphthalenivorans]GLR24202.1 lipoprotein signal peptidase [Ciceribacter naphthalenivorans]GLT07058.1 lipoprotein signal peptidase [Sphingomonas psychrolutea]